MRFEDDILSTYLDYVLNSDNLDFFNKVKQALRSSLFSSIKPSTLRFDNPFFVSRVHFGFQIFNLVNLLDFAD